ncbi:hypothetical protein ABPG74_016905 [Tetrahymena malaccensis]
MVFNRQGQFLEDFINFIESFVHYTLYLKNVYPETFFQVRTVFGLQIKVVKEGILYDYIHQLVEDTKQLLNSISIIRLNLIQSDSTKEYVDLVIDKSKIIEKIDSLPSQFERDQIFKSMLYKMSQKLQNNFKFQQNHQANSFELQIITNGQYAQSKEQKASLFEKWILEKETINITDQEKSSSASQNNESVVMIDEQAFIKSLNERSNRKFNHESQQEQICQLENLQQIQEGKHLIDIGHFTELSLIIIDYGN